MTEPDHLPDPAAAEQTIELDPPTAYVLVELLDVALQDGVLVEEPHEYAAFARLLSRINTKGSPTGELTTGVEENTALDGMPGLIYQEHLFEYYESETGITPPEEHPGEPA